MSKSPNVDLVNVIVNLLKEIQLVYFLSQGLSNTEKREIKKLLLKNNPNLKSYALTKIIDSLLIILTQIL
jgi:uncharacterized pyridoxamine 5'-phosphate oxidase family protein